MEIDGFKVSAKITRQAVWAAYKRRHSSTDDPGFCLACGAEVVSGVEPDAHGMECESCGEPAVIGVEDLALEML